MAVNYSAKEIHRRTDMTKSAAGRRADPLFSVNITRIPSMIRCIPVLVAALLLAGCVTPSSHILLGTPRAPISPDEVKLYTEPPAQPFEEIALLNASSGGGVGYGGQKSVDEVIQLMKVEAAKLGANGLLLGDIGDRQAGTFGTGVGSDSYSRNSAVGVDVGGSVGVFQKTGKGTAIYVTRGLCIVGCDGP
jgi:hypothetical protein